MPQDHAETSAARPDETGWWSRFRQQWAADNERNVDLRRWVGIGTIIIAVILDLLPQAMFLARWAAGGTTVDGNNLGAFLTGAVPAPLFVVSVVTAVWHLVLRRGPRVWPLFCWNVASFLVALLLGVVLDAVL